MQPHLKRANNKLGMVAHAFNAKAQEVKALVNQSDYLNSIPGSLKRARENQLLGAVSYYGYGVGCEAYYTR